MSLLAKTDLYLAEFEAGMLFISRYSDGNAVALKGRGIAGQFRDCLKANGAEKTINTYLRIAGKNWRPMYKPHRMPGRKEVEDREREEAAE